MTTLNPNWPKRPLQRKLASASYLIYDNAFKSDYFRVKGIEDSYGLGTHMFTVYGSVELVPRSLVYYEFIDSAGNIISVEGVENPDQAPSFAFTFEIDGSHADGIAIFSIVGSTKKNNVNRKVNNLITDLVWQLEIRVNKNKNVDFKELVAVENLQYASGGDWLISGTLGTASENNILLAWESMYSHTAQSASHADGIAYYVSNFKYKQVEKYYIYMFIPHDNSFIIPDNPPAYVHPSGSWILHGATDAARLSSSQYDNPTRSIYYFADNLPQDRHITFWVGTGKPSTLRWKSNKSTKTIAVGKASTLSSNTYWAATSQSDYEPDLPAS